MGLKIYFFHVGVFYRIEKKTESNKPSVKMQHFSIISTYFSRKFVKMGLKIYFKGKIRFPLNLLIFFWRCGADVSRLPDVGDGYPL